jgi:hypothetical protein
LPRRSPGVCCISSWHGGRSIAKSSCQVTVVEALDEPSRSGVVCAPGKTRPGWSIYLVGGRRLKRRRARDVTQEKLRGGRDHPEQAGIRALQSSTRWNTIGERQRREDGEGSMLPCLCVMRPSVCIITVVCVSAYVEGLGCCAVSAVHHAHRLGALVVPLTPSHCVHTC